MTQRSRLRSLANQQRAASRMTVATRMWSEQPVPPDRKGRATIVDPGAKVWADPVMREIHVRYDVTTMTTLYLDFLADDQVLLIISTSTPQPVTPAPGWEVVAADTVGGNTSYIITRKFKTSGSYPVASWGDEQHPFNEIDIFGFAFIGDYDYEFERVNAYGTIAPDHTLRDWSGDPDARRLRALVNRGMWTDYGDWPLQGFATGDAGWLSPYVAWYRNGGYVGSPSTYLLAPFTTGNIHGSGFGVSGPVTWTELHIEVK